MRKAFLVVVLAVIPLGPAARGQIVPPRPEPRLGGTFIEPARSVTVEVAIVEFAAGPGDREAPADPPEEIDAWLGQLEEEGRLLASTVVAISTVEGQRATARFGQQTPMPSRSTPAARAGRGGEAAVSHNIHDLGTMISATPHVGQNGTILLTLQLERSSIATSRRADAAGDAAAGEAVRPPIGHLSTESTLSLRNGRTTIAHRQTSRSPHGVVNTLILVTAGFDEAQAAVELDEAEVPGGQVQTFRLQNASAPQAASVLVRLMNGRPGSIGVDEQVNSIIVRGTPAELGRVADILMRLDQPRLGEASFDDEGEPRDVFD